MWALKEQHASDKKQFITFMKRCIKSLTAKLEGAKLDEFKKHIEAAPKFLLSKRKEFQFFVGESIHDESGIVLAYYEDGATDRTFLYFARGLKEVKC